jgi:hypothetical protein
LKEARAEVPVADSGRYVATLDSASTSSVNAYVASISKHLPAAAQVPGAANPAQAMAAWFKAKGIDSLSMSYEVVTTSTRDPNWKIDVASEPGGDKTYFLLHGVNGAWTVMDAGSSLTAAKMKAAGAPSDLKAAP